MSNSVQSRRIRIGNMIALLTPEQRRLLVLVLFEKRSQYGLDPFQFLFGESISEPQQLPVREVGSDTR